MSGECRVQNSGLMQKLKAVEDALRGFGRVLVAYSGGVDSTLLAKLARDILGKSNVLAVTADSPSLAREDLAQAIRLASELDLRHRVIPTREVRDPSYRANTTARCFFCKQELFQELEDVATSEDIPVIVYGAIADDLLAERPGQRAAVTFGVRAPLQEVGFSKREVRELARQLGLPNWNRPQNACLSSRIPHGLAVDEDKLRQVEEAEAFFRAEGFRQVRVRHLGAHARIEVEPDQVARFDDEALRQRAIAVLARIGFATIGVDRHGYRPGGADHALIDEIPLLAV